MSQFNEEEINFLNQWQKLRNEKDNARSLNQTADILRRQGVLLETVEKTG